MRISELEIENYKCHQNSRILASSQFHTFIGPNSCGKTSIIEACKLLKHLNEEIPDKTVVFGGIPEDDAYVEIKIRFVIDLTREERLSYFTKYLNLSPELLEPRTMTMILNRVGLTFTIPTRRTRKEKNDYYIILTGVDISNTNDECVTFKRR
ncbi:MAG: AAA family ATPase [Nitrososphaeraceae archaeon]